MFEDGSFNRIRPLQLALFIRAQGSRKSGIGESAGNLLEVPPTPKRIDIEPPESVDWSLSAFCILHKTIDVVQPLLILGFEMCLEAR